LKANVSAPVLLSVAAHFPLILPTTCEFEPQPASARISTGRIGYPLPIVLAALAGYFSYIRFKSN
jgi:hypothetical protein